MASAAPRRDEPGHGLELRPDYAAEPHCNVALAALAEAQAAIGRDDIEGRCAAVARATEAITALFLDLDARMDGRMVEIAARNYRALLAGLMRINLRNDAAAAREVTALLEPLRGAWTLSEGTRAVTKQIHHVR